MFASRSSPRSLFAALSLLCLVGSLACGAPGPNNGDSSLCSSRGLEGYALRRTALGFVSVDLPATVLAARQTILRYYLGSKDPVALLDAAWQGADAAARRHDITLPAELQPNLAPGATPSEREARLRLAFDRMGARLGDTAASREIIDAEIDSMAASLKDDHTGYESKEAWQSSQNSKILGIGLLGQLTAQGVLVYDVWPDSPAEAAGLQDGDLLVAVNGQPVTLSTRFPAQEQKRSYTVKRTGRPDNVEMELIPTPLSWLKSSLIDGQVGYLRLYEFPNVASCDNFAKFREQLDAAIDKLLKGGAKGWVLDVRSNPGGSANAAAYVAGRLGFDGLLATDRDAEGNRTPFETLGNNAIGDGPLVVLIDQRSASSSEIVAYDMQTERSATLFGERTAGAVAAAAKIPFGSGALQVTFALVDVGPTAHVIDRTGVAPDRRVPLDRDLLIQKHQDSQLNAALDYIKTKLPH